jgi:tetratricopeptide (TPR) repeat protein/TolB-like protein
VHPFHADFDQAIVYRILNEDPAPLEHYGIAAAAEMQGVVDRALAKDPGARFQTAQEIIDAIEGGSASPSRTPARAAVVRAGLPESSVAVLSFENLSGNPGDDWLCAGIAETVTVDLKRVGSLAVTARAEVIKSVADTDTRELAAERATEIGVALGVRWIVWGTFQKLGDSIRINPCFFSTVSGELAESFRIDGQMSGIFQMQDQIVTRLTDILHIEIESGELDRIKADETREEKAWEFYTRGRQLYNEFGVAQFDEIRELYNKALELDPEYALAVSGLGSLYVTRFINQPDPDDLTRGIELSEKAVELDPDIAEPLAWLTYFYSRRGDTVKAIETGRHAIEVEENNPLAHYFLGAACVGLHPDIYDEKRLREGMRSLRRCRELAPQYQPALMMRAWMFMLHGQYDDAETLCEEAAEAERAGTGWSIKFVGGFATHANLYVRQRRLESAQALYEEGLTFLEKSGHVYKVSFTAQTWCGLADIAFLKGQFDQASKLYGRAVDLAEANDGAIAMGYYYVRGNAGMAKSFFRLGVSSEVETCMKRAHDELQNRRRFNFSHMWEAHAAHAWFALADARMTMIRHDEALDYLTKAVEHGWRDLPQIEIDSRYRALHGNKQYRALVDLVRSSPRLP